MIAAARRSAPPALALLLACNDAVMSDTAASSTTAATTTAATTGEPTTTMPDPATSSTGTTSVDDTGAASSTGAALPSCVEHTDANACAGDDRCKWAPVFTYTHGANGCQGDLIDLCIEKQAGAPSTWYRGADGDYQVVGFDHVPTDLPGEWTPCGCDGPLACLCAFAAPDCPERLDEFCGATTSELACTGSIIHDEPVCGWFRTKPQGPNDDACTDQPIRDVCLPATNLGNDGCPKVDYEMSYDNCSVAIPPAYWREVDGVVEVTADCAVPTGWNLCDAIDTPEQPDECGCACNFIF